MREKGLSTCSTPSYYCRYGLLVIILLSSGCTCNPVIIEGPRNQAVLVNSTTTFHCMVEQHEALATYIFWDECITGGDGSCRRISNDNILVYTTLGGNPARQHRYSIESGGRGVYDLVISDVSLEDAGTYRCTASNAQVYMQVDLMVLEEPRCQSNISDDVMSVGDVVTMTCHVLYEGRWSPLMTWSVNGQPYSGDITTTSFKSDLTQTMYVKIGAEDPDQVFTVTTSFPRPLGVIGDLTNRAMNKPSYNFNVTFPVLKVEQLDPFPAMAVNPAEKHITTNDQGMHLMVMPMILAVILVTSLTVNLLLILYVRGTNLGPLNILMVKLTGIERIAGVLTITSNRSAIEDPSYVANNSKVPNSGGTQSADSVPTYVSYNQADGIKQSQI